MRLCLSVAKANGLFSIANKPLHPAVNNPSDSPPQPAKTSINRRGVCNFTVCLLLELIRAPGLDFAMNIPIASEVREKAIYKEIDAARILPTRRRVNRFRKNVLAWFDDNDRKFFWRTAGASNYVRIVAEVLLQRTRAEVVSSFLPRFLSLYSDWETLANVDEMVLGADLKPLGLWRRRAVSLRSLAREIVRRKGIWPNELESIPAVGQYVANAILLFEHASKAPLLDASVARLLRRYFDLRPSKADIRYDQLLQAVAFSVVAINDPVTINWGMLDLAASNCTSGTPKCASCPLRRGCRYRKSESRFSFTSPRRPD
jgi:A/G-specific adenine glycosylase